MRELRERERGLVGEHVISDKVGAAYYKLFYSFPPATLPLDITSLKSEVNILLCYCKKHTKFSFIQSNEVNITQIGHLTGVHASAVCFFMWLLK